VFAENLDCCAWRVSTSEHRHVITRDSDSRKRSLFINVARYGVFSGQSYPANAEKTIADGVQFGLIVKLENVSPNRNAIYVYYRSLKNPSALNDLISNGVTVYDIHMHRRQEVRIEPHRVANKL